ncbi:MAG: lipopolysaccharide biosynthesis protein [Granulosicoccus sp.]
MPAPRLYQHLRNYASAGMLSALVGLVTFPMLTRNLSVADYGIVGLITSSVTLFIAMGKLGMQHAVIRFFAQIRNSNIAFSDRQMNSSVSVVFLALAVVTTLLFLIMGYQVLPAVLQYENISTLFLLASAIVFVRILGSGIMNFLRAQQRSAEVAIAQSLARFLNLTLLVAVVLASALDPFSVITCLFFAELAGVCFVAYQYRSEFYFHHSEISVKLARAMLVYGMPLMILESLSLVLRLSDRYLIEAMLGVDELGQYSASYNLTSYLDIIILAAILQAVRPAYIQIWETQGSTKTAEFLSRGFHLYVVIGLPFIAMFSITSPYLLSFLAGPKYAIGTVIIPYVAVSFWLEGALYFLAAGLYIFKNTKVLMFCSLVATIINLGLNLVFIPRFGITGAAAVTVFSYGVFMVSVALLSFRHVKFRVEWVAPIFATLASLLVYILMTRIDFGGDSVNFLLKGFTGTLVLLVVIWMLAPETRNWLHFFLNKIQPGRKPS